MYPPKKKTQKSKKKQITKSLTRKLPGLDKAQDDEGEDVSQVTSQEKSQFHLIRKTTTQRLSARLLFSRCVCIKRQKREGMLEKESYLPVPRCFLQQLIRPYVESDVNGSAL